MDLTLFQSFRRMHRICWLLALMLIWIAADSVHAAQQAMQVTVTGNGQALGYTAIFWEFPFPNPTSTSHEIQSVSGGNLFSGSGTFFQDISNANLPLSDWGFIGLYGSFDGQNFTPAGVSFATTPTAANDIIANNKTFNDIFGEDEQTFIDDIRTPVSGLSFGGFRRWYTAEGAQVPFGTDATLLDFSAASSVGTVHVEVVPEPSCLALLTLTALPMLSRRRRNG